MDMANDRDQELERLEKELLADIAENDDLLADIPIELLDKTPATWTDDDFMLDESLLAPYPEEPVVKQQSSARENGGSMKQANRTRKTKSSKKRDDKVVITLMAIASFLCLGIIAVMIYWLEVFFK